MNHTHILVTASRPNTVISAGSLEKMQAQQAIAEGVLYRVQRADTAGEVIDPYGLLKKAG